MALLQERQERLLPDESENGYIGKNNVGVQINSSDPSDPNRANKIANGEWDGEPDLYILTTSFESVPFVLMRIRCRYSTSPRSCLSPL